MAGIFLKLITHNWTLLYNLGNSNLCSPDPLNNEQPSDQSFTNLGSQKYDRDKKKHHNSWIKYDKHTLKSLLEIFSHSACTQTLQPSQHTWSTISEIIELFFKRKKNRTNYKPKSEFAGNLTQSPPSEWCQIFLQMPQYCFDFRNCKNKEVNIV